MLSYIIGLYQSSTNPHGCWSVTSKKSRLKSANIIEFICQYSLPLSFLLPTWMVNSKFYLAYVLYNRSGAILQVMSCTLRECNEVGANQLQRRGQKRVLLRMTSIISGLYALWGILRYCQYLIQHSGEW